MSCHVMLCSDLLYSVTLWIVLLFLFYHIISYHVISCHVMSCYVLFCYAMYVYIYIQNKMFRSISGVGEPRILDRPSTHMLVTLRHETDTSLCSYMYNKLNETDTNICPDVKFLECVWYRMIRWIITTWEYVYVYMYIYIRTCTCKVGQHLMVLEFQHRPV